MYAHWPMCVYKCDHVSERFIGQELKVMY